jgi:predicted DCC family thiol-disulfide oxidoreductase YuxK
MCPSAVPISTEQQRAVVGNVALLLYVGHCRMSRRAATCLYRLDVFRRLDLVSFRHDDSYLVAGIQLRALEQELHFVSGSQVWRGFPAVLQVVRRLPLLWPLLPFCWMAERLGLGQRLYRCLAANRVIVDPTACSVGSRRPSCAPGNERLA